MKAFHSLLGKRSGPAAPPPPDPVTDLGPVIKSPLDSKDYKAIQLGNGLRALLVSTCVHEIEGGGKCDNPKSHERLNESIKEFNRKYLGINSGPPPATPPPSKKPSKPPKKDKKQSFEDWSDWLLKLGNNYWSKSDEGGTTATTTSCIDNNMLPPKAKKPKLLRCCYGPTAICVTVGIGSLHDPVDVPGMAHLLEHAVFLGSKEFPEPGELFRKVHESHLVNGMVNASTFSEYTQYYFTCNPTVLEQAMEVLVDGITNPSLKEDVIRKEIEAVDSEYAIKQTSDYTRLNDFIRSLAKKNHPLNTFYWGNKKTLSHPFLIPKMREWHRKYYGANYMTVCIQAPYPVGMIEQIVVKQFSNIPPAPLSCLTPEQELLKCSSPFEESSFCSQYYIVPVCHYTCLVITWALPSDFWKDYMAKPLHCVRKLLNSVGPGGLIEYMRNMHWITLVEDAEATCSCSDYFCKSAFGSMFSINVILTDKGYKEKEDVLLAIFSYIKLLKEMALSHPGYFEEMKKTLANSFHFQNWDEMLESARTAALALQQSEPQHVLTSQKLIMNFNGDAIQSCLNHLRPRSACFLYVSNGKENTDKCKARAWACDMRYNKVPMKDCQYKRLEEGSLCGQFRLPDPGTFLSKEIHLPGPLCDKLKLKNGVAFESEKVVIDHLNEKKSPCVTQKIPSAMIAVELASPIAASEGRIRDGTLNVWNMVIKDRVLRKVGNRYDDGLCDFQIAEHSTGIAIIVAGPSCHLVELLETLLTEAFITPDIEPICPVFYDDLRLGMVKEFVSDLHEVQVLADDMMDYLLLNGYPSMFHIKDAIQGVSYDEFLRLMKTFKSRMKVNVEIQGTICQRSVDRLVAIFNKIQYKPVGIFPAIPERGTILPRGSSLLAMQGLHPGYVTSVVKNCYQFGLLNKEQRDAFDTLRRYMQMRLKNQLRTSEQLGYAIYLSKKVDFGVAGLGITVITQPNKFTCAEVDNRIENFLKLFYEKYLNARIDPNKNIFSPCLSPANPKPELEEIRKLYREYLLPDGASYRKLSIQVQGFLPSRQPISKKKHEELRSVEGDDDSEQLIQLEYLEPPKDKKGKQKGYHVIGDVCQFKRTLGLYPSGFDLS